MPAPDRIGRESPLSVRDWLARAGLSVALAAVLGTVQVAVLWSQGLFHGAPEAIAAEPSPSGVSCANCGWWPWNDQCRWVETGDQRGISFSEPQFTRLDNICNPPESNRDMTWNCNCAVSIGEKLYKWMPAVKVAVTIPSAKVLQAFQITGEWDGNKTITKTMTKGLSGSIPPGQCGPGEVYCYRSRSYIQTLYRRQLGKVTGVSVVQNPAGTDTVVYSYSYDTCNAPCEGDYSVLEGPPSPWLSFTVYDPDHQPPLADACK
jgi:hypothetical protein